MKNSLILIGCLFITVSLHAQKKQKWFFHSSNSMGLLTGDEGSKFSMNSVNGFQKKNWSIGLGLGIDPYGYSSIPVYADVRKAFGSKLWKPFVYADAGPSIPLPNKDLPKTWMNGQPAFDLKIGWIYEMGLGVQRKLVGSTDFFLQIGYSQKAYSYVDNQNLRLPDPFPWGTSNPIKYDYTYRRWVVKMGITL